MYRDCRRKLELILEHPFPVNDAPYASFRAWVVRPELWLPTCSLEGVMGANFQPRWRAESWDTKTVDWVSGISQYAYYMYTMYICGILLCLSSDLVQGGLVLWEN